MKSELNHKIKPLPIKAKIKPVRIKSNSSRPNKIKPLQTKPNQIKQMHNTKPNQNGSRQEQKQVTCAKQNLIAQNSPVPSKKLECQ